jgi:DNA-binding MarR family transcriptional regulator
MGDVTTDTASATGSIVLLTRLARVVYRRSTEDLLGLRLKDLAALAYLRDHERATQHALSEGLCVDANNCVLLLNELEVAGLVERRRVPSDRRRHIVELTTAGRQALDRAEHAQESVEDEVLGGLTAAERSTLRRLLDRALESQAPAPSDP